MAFKNQMDPEISYISGSNQRVCDRRTKTEKKQKYSVNRTKKTEIFVKQNQQEEIFETDRSEEPKESFGRKDDPKNQKADRIKGS